LDVKLSRSQYRRGVWLRRFISTANAADLERTVVLTLTFRASSFDGAVIADRSNGIASNHFRSFQGHVTSPVGPEIGRSRSLSMRAAAFHDCHFIHSIRREKNPYNERIMSSCEQKVK